MDKRLFRYNTEIKIVQSSIKKLNPQFSLCDILVCYHGDNRNMTSLPKKTIEDNLFSIYGIPIVGEWVYKLDGTDEKTWGSHGGRIILDDKGIHFEQTTKPFGFVSKEAADNASWVTITEKDGHTQNEYLKLSGCILWTDRYEESKSILDENYGQSMEIEFVKGHYRDDHYYEAEEFIFSALCILGTKVTPCFESACIGRHYELDSFKKEFSLMLDEYKKSIITPKGEQQMDLTKFTNLLSEIKVEGKETLRYRLLSADDSKIYVFDRHENYKLFSVEYVMNEENPIINWDTKTEGDISFAEKSDENDSHMTLIYKEVCDEIKSLAATEYEVKLDEKIQEVSNEITDKFNNLQADYDTLKASYSIAKEKLDKFEAVETERAKQEHIDTVKNIVNKYEKKIGKHPNFLFYKAKLNFEKADIDTVEKDLTLMSGDILMGKKSAATFSYHPQETNVNKYGREDIVSKRYGNLLDKFINK